MQRWHLTVGLAAVAVAAAIIAPRLTPLLTGTPDTTDTTDPIPELDGGDTVKPDVTADITPEVPTGHLTVTAELDRDAILDGHPTERFLAINVTAPDDLGDEFRRPVDIAVVMDVSGSMSARGKIDYAKRAAKHLAVEMERDDTYSLVTFATNATTVVPPTRVDDPARIHNAIDGIIERGSTNIYAGMEMGATQVRAGLHGENVGRIVILSDGNATVGITDDEAISRLAADFAAEGISVSAIGLGLDYNEDLLARVAEVSGGTYDFVDDPRELQTVFADELDRTASVVARNTTVDVQLPPGVQPLEVYGWNAKADGDGWSVYLGDMYAGETKKIIARVRVQGTELGDMTVADVDADYFDLVDARDAQSTASATALVTRDQRVVSKSVNKDAAAASSRAYGNWYLDQSARAYKSGDRNKAKRLAGEGEKVLRQAAADNADSPYAESLSRDADRAGYYGGVFASEPTSSPAAARAIKQSKEDFLEAAQ